MKVESTSLPGVLLVQPRIYPDARGLFYESYQESRLAEATGLALQFVQDNHAESHQHVLRGLHFQQSPHAQGKLVRVVLGRVFDVVVDIRPLSPTFGRWLGVELSALKHEMLWIPPGLAHGYLTLSEHSIFLYKTTHPYTPSAEQCLRWDDPSVAINWPLPLGQEPLLSPKDAQGLTLQELKAQDLLT